MKPMPKSMTFDNRKVLLTLISIIVFFVNVVAQNPCKPDIIGIWSEEQDPISALLAGPKAYKFYEGDKVEIYQYDFETEKFISLGDGNYRLELGPSSSKIIFYNLTVLIFPTEGSFVFPITKFENSTLEWQGVLGIITRLNKIYIPTYDVPLISQENRKTCWAASAAMMYSWKKNKIYKIEDAISEIEWPRKFWSIRLSAPNGISSEELDEFYENRMGLIQVKFTPTIKGLQELLLKHGPLLIALDNNLDDSTPAYHVRVINGISGDGSDQCTLLNILDPWPFENYEQIRLETYEDFKKKAYKSYTGKLPENFRIYHW